MLRIYFWRSSESRSDRWYKPNNTRRTQRMQTSDSSSLCSLTTSSSFLSVSRHRRDLKRHQIGHVHHGKRNRKSRPCDLIKDNDQELTVFNLSSKTLNSSHISVLNKGLSFVLCFDAKDFDIKIDLYKFFRNIRIKEFFLVLNHIFKNVQPQFKLRRVEPLLKLKVLLIHL